MFEVLSPSTRGVDLVRKSDEYRCLPEVRHIVLIEPDRARALVWSTEGGDGRSETVKGLDGVLALPAIGVSLPMSAVYEGVTLVA